ncbi:MAG: Dam family site-specific DNA-(adenine-N6)-methyltransferase [Hyphomicrobiales bacterium]
MTIVPPLKSQGIKTKLVGWIRDCSAQQPFERWVEPFMGTGVVAFNVQPRTALLCDSNPHLIRFYKAIQTGKITADKARRFLTDEGAKLLQTEDEHYYVVRDRFNSGADPLDLLFLSRSCFNGMMRFNRCGGFNVPFCRKANRFAQALVTRIAHQIAAVSHVIGKGDYAFKHQAFQETLSEVDKGDFVYCDPPYIGRHVDYFNSWSEEEEKRLHDLLMSANTPFIRSTWLRNRYRVNNFVFSLWNNCSILVKKHFYHVGAREDNRNTVSEALLVNFQLEKAVPVKDLKIDNISLAKETMGGTELQIRMADEIVDRFENALKPSTLPLTDRIGKRLMG